MKLHVTILCLFFFGVVKSQNLTANWHGAFLQQGHKENINIELNLTQSGNKLMGTFKYVLPNVKQTPVNIEGVVLGSTISINELDIKNTERDEQSFLKKLTGNLRIDTVHKLYIIEGKWRSNYPPKSKSKRVPLGGAFWVMASFNTTNNKIPADQNEKLSPENDLTKTDKKIDGYYLEKDLTGLMPPNLAKMRSSDVNFLKAVWREIDVREKANQYLASPKSRLIDVLLDGIEAGEITAFDPVQDTSVSKIFSTPLTSGQIKSRLGDSVVVNTFDKNGNKIGFKTVVSIFDPDKVVIFRIQEIWVFDKQRSVFEPRIIGLAPMMKHVVSGVEINSPLFWISFQQAREVLAVKMAVNKNNDAAKLSFDDVFTKRLFTSYITKVSNTKDERVEDYTKGTERVKEAEKLKKKLMDADLNRWQNN